MRDHAFPASVPTASVAPSALWRRLLPAGVTAFETRNLDLQADLHLEERALVANAMDKRTREFAAGRLCARAALAAMGVEDRPLLRGEGRRPAWPEGTVGSITHTDAYAAAVVANANDLLGVGIDAEEVGRVTEGIERVVCTPAERDRLSRLEAARRAEAATVIFSAKEAFYKSQSSLEGAMSSFQDVDLTLGDGAFRVVPRDGVPRAWIMAPLVGRYAVVDGLAFTAFALPNPKRRR